MRPASFILLGLFMQMPFCAFAKDPVKKRDYAVFRVETKAYFLSDVNRLMGNLEHLHCFSGHSILFNLLPNNAWKRPLPMRAETLEDKKNQALFLGLIDLVKVVHFVENRHIDLIGKEFVWPKKCGRVGKKIPLELRSLANTYYYLKDRFKADVGKKGKTAFGPFVETIKSKTKHFEFF